MQGPSVIQGEREYVRPRVGLADILKQRGK